MGIEKIIVADYQEMSARAATLVAQRMKAKPRLVLGLATGATPIGLYQQLVAMSKRGEIDWSEVTTFNLDEYVGLTADHQQSYRYFMNIHLFDQVNIDRQRVYFPEEERGEEYEQEIRKVGGVDLQVLGIGRNGHIGFNEPGSPFDSRTRVVDLTDTTIEDNARFFQRRVALQRTSLRREEVPKRAVTMGLATIMEAKEILLLASGAGKAAAVREMGDGEVSIKTPASVLQGHEKVTIIMDSEAGGRK